MPSGSRLENYLIANGYNYDGTTTGNKIAKSMASTTGWNSSSNTGAIGNEQSLNNSSGFNAFPEGYSTALGGFGSDGRDAVFFGVPLEFEMDNASDAHTCYNSTIAVPWTVTTAWGMAFRYAFVRDASSVGANGSILLNGTVSAENNQIKNVADPTEAQDVTTKSYVDNSVSNTYTQAEVDAIISSLQEQIDALQTTTGSGTVTDQDGNSYPYLTYGDQVMDSKKC